MNNFSLRPQDRASVLSQAAFGLLLLALLLLLLGRPPPARCGADLREEDVDVVRHRRGPGVLEGKRERRLAVR